MTDHDRSKLHALAARVPSSVDVEEAAASLPGLADQANRTAKQLSDSIANERAAIVELLDAVVEYVRPGLDAICSRVIVARANGNPVYSMWRGIAVAEMKESALILCADGHWMALHYGRVSAGSDWCATCHQLDTRGVAELRPDVGEIARSLANALQRFAGGAASKRAQQADDMASRVRAVATLLQGDR